MLSKTVLQLFFLGMALFAQAQQTRYFQFTVACGHGNWQDSSFVAATNNQTLIDSVLANLARPLEERQFIAGPIAAGHGGHNHNASHWFKWHFVPNEWTLADVATEVCDGCPYSDVDSDTTYWLHNIGQFCPWSGQPLKEVSAPTNTDDLYLLDKITLYPNPAANAIYIDHAYKGGATVSLHDALGRLVYQEQNFTGKMLNVRPYSEGVYWLTIIIGQKRVTEKVIVQR